MLVITLLPFIIPLLLIDEYDFLSNSLNKSWKGDPGGNWNGFCTLVSITLVADILTTDGINLSTKSANESGTSLEFKFVIKITLKNTINKKFFIFLNKLFILFFLYKQSSADGKLIIRPGFKQSKTKVPVDPVLLAPGKTGKVVAARHVFRDKASIMESGKPIIYRTTKNIPIPQNGQLRFVAAGTIIKNYHPGGKEVKGSFEKFYNYWFSNKVNSVIESSGMLDKIDVEVARILSEKGAGSTQVKTAIINLLKQYSKGEIIIWQTIRI